MRRWTLWALLALLPSCDDGGDADPQRDAGIADARPDAEAAPDLGAPDAEPADGATGPDAEADAGEPMSLIAEAGEPQTTFVDVGVLLDGSASEGAVTYQWDLGDGSEPEPPGPDPQALAVYDTPGRYRATLTVADADGATRRDQVVITVVTQPTHAGYHSDTLSRLEAGAFGAAFDDPRRFAVVVTDDDAVVILGQTEAGFERVARLPTPPDPRTLLAWTILPERPTTSARLAVVSQASGVVRIYAQLDGERLGEVALPPGSRPYAAAPGPDRTRLYVTLQGTGQLAELTGGVDDDWQLGRIIDIGPDVRGIGQLPDGRLAITRWRSTDARGELWIWHPDEGAPPMVWPLAYDPQAASDTEIGGVPNYLDQVLVAPSGLEIALPSSQAHFAHGSFTSGEPAAPDEVLRAVVSFMDVAEGRENFERRKQFDGRGLASAGVYTRGGDYLYLAMRGSRTVERLDRFSGNQSGALVDTGHAVEGLALTRDDRLLLVNATLDRAVKVYDVSDLSVLPTPIAEIPLVDVEPLAPEILLGKQLFNDSADPRLSAEGYIACAHCHLEGDGDHRTWDFSDRGEGLRQTISLLGRRGTGHGPIHWSGNFDEGQDFENDIRGPFGGLGLMTDDDFHAGTRAMPLGDPKAGLSAELDALAAYMASLDAHLQSPHRGADGALSEAADRGRALFFSEAVGCGECHPAPRLTDSQLQEDGAPLLHDVGTLTEASGSRLGGALTGLDTPTLHGLWHSAPYLHDGSAPTLRAVLTTANPEDAHGRTSQLTEEALSDLEAYLLSLDGRWE